MPPFTSTPRKVGLEGTVVGSDTEAGGGDWCKVTRKVSCRARLFFTYSPLSLKYPDQRHLGQGLESLL